MSKQYEKRICLVSEETEHTVLWMLVFCLYKTGNLSCFLCNVYGQLVFCTPQAFSTTEKGKLVNVSGNFRRYYVFIFLTWSLATRFLLYIYCGKGIKSYVTYIHRRNFSHFFTGTIDYIFISFKSFISSNLVICEMHHSR